MQFCSDRVWSPSLNQQSRSWNSKVRKSTDALRQENSQLRDALQIKNVKEDSRMYLVARYAVMEKCLQKAPLCEKRFGGMKNITIQKLINGQQRIHE